MSKLVFKMGADAPGTAIPRVLNPLVFLAAAAMMSVTIVLLAIVIVCTVVSAPFSWLTIVKIGREE